VSERPLQQRRNSATTPNANDNNIKSRVLLSVSDDIGYNK